MIQRFVEADEAAALVPALARRQRNARRQEHQQDERRARRCRSIPVHADAFRRSPRISRCPAKVCENYHAFCSVSIVALTRGASAR